MALQTASQLRLQELREMFQEVDGDGREYRARGEPCGAQTAKADLIF